MVKNKTLKDHRHHNHTVFTHREDEGDESGEAGADLLLGEELALLHEQVLEALHLLADDAALLEYAQNLGDETEIAWKKDEVRS